MNLAKVCVLCLFTVVTGQASVFALASANAANSHAAATEINLEYDQESDVEFPQGGKYICTECTYSPRTGISSYCLDTEERIICESFSRLETCMAARNADTRCR